MGLDIREQYIPLKAKDIDIAWQLYIRNEMDGWSCVRTNMVWDLKRVLSLNSSKIPIESCIIHALACG